MLKIERTDNGYRLSGEIDEAAEFSALPDADVELDLSGIRRINSTGVRKWIEWKENLAKTPILSNVPSAIVMEISLIPQFARGLRVKSVKAPYFDPKKGVTEEMVITGTMLAELRATRIIPKFYNEVGQELEFDEDENNFFGFLGQNVEILS